MEVEEAIRKRSSIRRYQDREVDQQDLLEILEAGRWAPSAVNRQPWHFIVIEDQGKRERLSGLAKFGKFIKDAPVFILGCGDVERAPDRYIMDVCIALEHMVLMATSLGLGSCWIGTMDKEAIREMLDIPSEFNIVAGLTLGHLLEGQDPLAEELGSGSRRPLEEIVSRERFGRPFGS